VLSPLGVYHGSVMPPWRDADNLGAQLFTTDALHVSERVTICVGHTYFDQIISLLQMAMHVFLRSP
jgi:hypothetical protein